MTKYIARLYDKNNKFLEEITIPHCYPLIKYPIVLPPRAIDGKLLPEEASYIQSCTFRLNREERGTAEPYEYIKRIRYDEVDEE